MSYLDTNKSVMISSPAGSGKTEKLARRYIALLQKGVDAEKILAVTFTEKAAAEMKQRILKILRDEDRELFKKLLDKMPLMRVSTIHSFCGTLLRRFSCETATDPNYNIEDAIDSSMTWEETIYETLMDAGKGDKGHEFLIQSISEKGFRGIDYLKGTVDYLFQKSPFSFEADDRVYTPPSSHTIVDELKAWPGVKDVIEGYHEFFKKGSFREMPFLEKHFLTDKKEPRRRPPPSLRNIADYQDWAFKMYMFWRDNKMREHAKRTERIKEIFNICLDKYTDKKRAKGILDFSDLEYIAYKMLTENPEWTNILYAFDEKTDHILVDEFQDTNSFQWAIINKLTEEWRSGLGAKRDEGIKPTIFFVGDEKQSIYFFRGANVEIFHTAREKLQRWLGDEFCYEEAKENFRSRPAIIDFTNHVFSRIMSTGEVSPPWMTYYNAFSACGTGSPDSGRVELVLMDDNSPNISEAKRKESEVLAQRIQGLVGNFQITDKGIQHQSCEPDGTRQRHGPDGTYQRPCRYMDIAILLRKRTHLKKYEESLRHNKIPFVAVKGIGFYQEPEIATLRALVYFLSNTKDDYSLYILLKSPLFQIDEGTIIQVINRKGDCLFSKLQGGSSKEEKTGMPSRIKESVIMLREWLSQIPYTPISELIDHALVRTEAWRYFHEAQTRANIKKFIRIVEDLETNGKSLLKIRNFLERTRNKNEEPKANVNTEGMDAVKIMTIHAAKGLEFPIVFIPGLEEPFTSQTGDSLIYEKNGKFFFKSEPDSSIRKQDEDFLVHLAKEEEEQKRLFYVAITRAEEALILISHWSGRDNNFLGFLKRGLELQKKNSTYGIGADIKGFSLLTAQDVKMLHEHAPKPKAASATQFPVKVIPTKTEKHISWKTVTETVDIKRRHGKEWVVLGDILHRIFDGISKGIIQDKDIRARAQKLIESKVTYNEQRDSMMIAIIEKDIAVLKAKGIWQEIILPRKDSFSELPFIYNAEDVVYTGRIDRIIKDVNTYKIYDYKTFPVIEKETLYLLKEYSVQLNLYKRAVSTLFNTKDVKSFIIFTHIGEIREV